MTIQLKKFGEILTSRPAGREAWLALSAYQLKGLKPDEPIIIDFKGVKVLSPSWADEVITKIVSQYPKTKLKNASNSSVQATIRTLREYSGIKI